MHIDFAPPSNGIYNNVGSSRQLANYMEHEDLERMEKRTYIDGFFNLTEDNIYKSKVIKDMDTNIGQLLKIDAKFYAIHVSPSEKELRAMGNTEQEQAEAMKRYIRKVFIPEYAKNFNKGLSEIDIKFYGKIHFDRNRSDNELNIHCHLIVSRKDQANKKKLSPLTNHKNTKKGAVTGGFDRVNLFQQAEQGFNKLFGYDRQQSESFNYHNTMKNNSIFEQLKQQEVQICEKKTENKENNNQESLLSINPENNITDGQASNITTKHEKHTSSANSLFPFFLPKTSSTDEENLLITKKKRKRALHKR
ncbi:clindamycin resistance transfer factor BtgB [Bacteroides sp. 4_1_36]|nr:clindamycin resistance transfer factor BtgB [Bacteroides sp. 4_1_36]